jgi:hypothetical protein
MRSVIAILACALALAACKKEQSAPSATTTRVVTTVIPEKVREQKNLVIRPDVPNVLDKALLGTTLAADGTVAEEAKELKAGAPVSLTIWIKESPPGLNTGVIWYGKDGEEIEKSKRPMNGGKVVTFTLKKKLTPGRYRAEGYWGGNVVADKTFEVVK